jgi:hypothetical protein
MARTFAALLVDSDLKGLESLVYGFQGASWRSAACAAPETAAFLIKASAAEIAVIAARPPYDKTLTLLRQLRASEETRTLPLLVLGPASLRPSALDCGTIDFLPTPVFVRDVIAASRILVSLNSHATHAQGHEASVDGTLADFGFFSLIRVMCALPRSGVLHIERAKHRGEIFFSDGEIAGAQVGSLQGPPAIHHLLLWEDAKIELRLRAVTRRTQFHQKLDQVMDEAERFVRDYTHAIQGIGPASSVYGKNDEKLAQAAVPSEVTPVLRLCDGRRTLTDIIDESPFRVFDTVRILTRLADLGVLTRCQPQECVPASAPALDKFWQTARIASSDDSIPLSQRPTPARIGQADVRMGAPSRRKGQRRAVVQTPTMGMPVVDDTAPGMPVTGATGAGAAPVGQGAEASASRASGSIDVSVAGNRRQFKSDRRNSPSVTIDAALAEGAASSPPAAVPVEITATSAVSPELPDRVTGTLQVAPHSSPRHPHRGQHIAGSGTSIEIDPGLPSETSSPVMMASSSVPQPQTAPLAGSSGAAPAVTAGPGPDDRPRAARVTGTLSITPSRRSGTDRARARAVSVELDPVLMAELGHLEKATAPMGPPTAAEPHHAEPSPSAVAAPSDAALGVHVADTSSSSKSDHTGRATGTLSISASSRASANVLKTPATGISIALDPALLADAQKLIAPKSPSSSEPRTAALGSGKGQSRGTSGGRTAPATARPTPHPSDDSASQTGKRISGAFSAIERDFFDREADLYKREAEDNFADLDEPAGKRNGKLSPGGGAPKRRA